MKQKILISLLLVTCLSTLCVAQEPPVSWFDDFIGVRINPAYSVTLSGTGAVRIAEGLTGGGVLLAAHGYGTGAGRLRLGEDPMTGPGWALNFTAKKNLAYQTRVYFNRNTEIAATVGLIGFEDPKNVIAALYGDELGWVFEVANDDHRILVNTGFRHAPGCWVTFKIVTEWGEIPKVSLYIDDKLAAEVMGEYVPVGGLCPEFQIWNKELDGAYSQPTMWVDYLSLKQDR